MAAATGTEPVRSDGIQRARIQRTIRVSDDLDHAALRHARDNDMSYSQVVRLALREMFGSCRENS